VAKDKIKELIKEFYLLTLEELVDGQTFATLEKAVYYHEVFEEYEACEGILRALEFADKATLKQVKKEIYEIRNNHRGSRADD